LIYLTLKGLGLGAYSQLSADAEGLPQTGNWQHVARHLLAAAAGADTADVSIALRMVLSMEAVACRQR